MTNKSLARYESDEGALTATQMRQIKRLVPQDKKRSVRSSLVRRHPHTPSGGSSR
jgi:hypothetical protein